MYFSRAALLVVVAVAGLGSRVGSADVGPPLEIHLAADGPIAVAGQEFASVFTVDVGKPGVLSDFAIKGEGWTVVSAQFPAAPLNATVGSFVIPFRAIPADPDKPIALRLRWNGRLVRQQYRVGPRFAARRARSHLLMSLNESGAKSPRMSQPVLEGSGDDAGGGDVVTGGPTVVVSGKIVYPRPGLDRNGDGDFTDPNGDIPPMNIGADNIRVRVWDEDPVGRELMWEGFSDELGEFVTPALNADVDGDGSGPDLVLEVEAYAEGQVEVTDSSVGEYTYIWETPEDTDYALSHKAYGTLTPLDPNEQPAIHIYNSMMRTRRFLLEKAGRGTPEVQIEWPDDSRGNTAWYEDTLIGTNEIHISSGRTWREDTHSHEYGHHYIDSAYVNDPPDPQYCNSYCDPNDPLGNCGGPRSANCGHCLWCPENANDAFNEGWPNWLADAVTRDYSDRYVYDNGEPYEPLNTRDQENVRTCCQDGQFGNAIMTEGFVGAFLRDLEDATQDDHDSDGVFDIACVGYEPIIRVAADYEPYTVLDFINAFVTEFPNDVDKLYATAFNVSPLYVANLPSDSAPPGVVPAMDSESHPLGIGGSLSCITFQFEPAPDDATGCTSYAYTVSTTPAGVDPGTTADLVTPADNCKLQATVPAFALGDYYISIRARDNAGNWSSSFATFGPFTVLDCNGSGFLDACDIRCCDPNNPDCQSIGTATCQVSASPVCGAVCGISEDCNGNFIPDECDIADGRSLDCNNDGIPDECQPRLKYYSGLANTPTQSPPADVTDWSDPANWRDLDVPADGDMACVPASVPTSLVDFSEDFLRLESLSCQVDFRISQDAFSPDLELDANSYVDGDLTISGQSTLRVRDTLDVGGALNWNDRTIYGPGDINVHGGFDLNPADGRTELRSAAHLSILDGAINLNGSKWVGLFDTSVFTIGLPVVYTYSGDFAIFTGGLNTLLEIDGQLIRASGAGRATVSSPVDNAGLIHNQSGELSLSSGGVHSGFLLSDPGTLLTLGNSHDFLTSSVLATDDLTWVNAGTSFVRGDVNTTGDLKVDGGSATYTNEANVTSYGQNLFVRSGNAHFQAPTAGPTVDFNSVTVGETGVSGGVSSHFDTGQPVRINTLRLARDSIYGADPITVNTAFIWNSGTLQSGGLFSCDAPMTVQSTGGTRVLRRTLDNNAYASFVSGSLSVTGPGVFNNSATGTIDFQAGTSGITSGPVNNAGLIVKSAGAGRATLAGANNSNMIHNQSGELYMSGGGVNTGDILSDPGTLLSLVGSHEMLVGSSLTADEVYCFNITGTVRGGVNIAGTLTVDGGTLTFTNEANVASYGRDLFVRRGLVHFNAPVAAPTLDFNSVTIGETGLSGGKEAYFNTGQPISINTLAVANGNLNGADPVTVNDSFTFNSGSINAGGDITINGPSTVNSTGGTRTLRRDLNNAATMTILSGGISVSGADFNNLAGGVIDIRTDGGKFGLTTNATLNNDGALIKSAGAGASSISMAVRNAGTIDIQTGVLQLYAGNSIRHIQTAGQTILDGGDLSMTHSGVYEVQGGKLTGSGTVMANVDNSGGVVAPGMSSGAINITLGYTQSAAGVYEVELGGTNAGEFDVLNVTGAAGLAGDLNIALIDGYNQTLGDTFVILTAGAISGTFDTLSGAPDFDVSYTATEVILTSTATTSIPGDLDGDCDVDLADLSVILANFGTPSGALPEDGDLDGDGDVDLADLSVLLSNFGSTC